MSLRRLVLGLVLAAAGGAATTCAQTGDVRPVHDPVLIRAEGAYYLFCTGHGIPIRRSRDLVRWERAGSVFDGPPAWALKEVPGARDIWAPDISKAGDEYRLYYSVSTWGRNRSVIGLAVNRTLDPARPDYRWIDRGKVVESARADPFNAIDPNAVVTRDVEGSEALWLAFGSFWSGIKLCRIDRATGLPSGPRPELISLAARPPPNTAIEAPFIVQRGGFHYLFVSFDQCCKGVDSTYRIMVGRARDVTGPYEDRAGHSMTAGGGTELLVGNGHVRGPGHCAVLEEGDRYWLVHHYYDARADGARTLQIRPLTWSPDGWPAAGEPMTP